MNAWDHNLEPAVQWVLDVIEHPYTESYIPEGTYFEWWVHENDHYNSTVREIFAPLVHQICYDFVYIVVPEGVNASEEIDTVETATIEIWHGIDSTLAYSNDTVAMDQFYYGFRSIDDATITMLFDSFSVTVAKSKEKKGDATEASLKEPVGNQYYNIFDLVMPYTFIAVSYVRFLLKHYH